MASALNKLELKLSLKSVTGSLEVWMPTPRYLVFPSDGTRDSFWVYVLEQLAQTFRQPPARNRPGIPMFGGHGVLNLESRHRLEGGYFEEIPPRVRAAALLLMLDPRYRAKYRTKKSSAQPAISKATKGRAWIASQFRLASALHFDLARITICNCRLEDEVCAGERWAVVLAALLMVALEDASRDWVLGLLYNYEAVVGRLRAGVSIDTPVAASSSSSGVTGGPAHGEQQRIAAGCAGLRTLTEDLKNPFDRSPWLARVFLHVVCQRLRFKLGQNAVSTRRFFIQLCGWIESEQLWDLSDGLKKLTSFGGDRNTDPEADFPDAAFPALFMPYDGSNPVCWDDVDRVTASLGLCEDTGRALKGAYLAAVQVADQFVDPLRAQYVDSQRVEASANLNWAGFSWPAYFNAFTRTTEKGTGLPPHPEGEMLKRLYFHLGESDQIAIQLAQNALKDARGPYPSGCIGQ